MRNMRMGLCVALAVCASVAEAWQVLPAYGGGYMQNVLIAPSNPKVWYTYADVGGPYRSDDAGATWRALHGNMDAATRAVSGDLVRSMSVDPRNENIFVLASGGSAEHPAGLYLSRDGGQTFARKQAARFAGNGDKMKFAGDLLARDPFAPDTLVAAGEEEGVFLSRDNGEHWQRTGALAKRAFSDIRYDRVVRGRLYACAHGAHTAGLFRSDDGGARWKRLTEEAPYEIGQIAGQEELIGYFPTTRALRRSMDGGATWAAFDEGLPVRTGEGLVAKGHITAIGTGRDFYLIGDGAGNIYRRTLGESAWTPVKHLSARAANLVTEPRLTWTKNASFDALGSLIVDPTDNAHFLATDFYEIWESRDAGTNWTTRIQGIMQLVSHTLEFDPFSADNIVYAVADMGLYWSADGGKTFRHPGLSIPSRGWVYACSASYSRQTKGLAMICGGKGPGIVLRSRDGGHYWQDPALRGLPKLDGTNPGVRAYSIAANPAKEEFYICLSGPVGKGRGGIYRTANGGDDWTWIGDGLPEGQDLFRHGEWAGGGVFAQINFATDGSAVCFSTKAKRRWHLAAGGTRWEESPDCPGICCADPFRPGRMLGGGWPIRETLDGGKTWHKLETNLGRVLYVHCDQHVAGQVVAGLPDRTVWLSRNGGRTFEKIEGSDRVPSGGSSKVVIDRNRLYYLTTGSGVWTMTLPPPKRTKVQIWLDTEDYTTDHANDAIRDLANLLAEEGIRAHFNVVGFLAQRLRELNRTDVIAALKPHLIGTQTLYHSRHPTVSEMSDAEDYGDAYRAVALSEAQGIGMLKAAFGLDNILFTCLPGDSSSSVVMEAYADMGIPFLGGMGMVCLDEAFKRRGEFWLCNMHHLVYNDHAALEMFLPGHGHSPESEKANLDDWAKRGSIVLSMHPNMVLYEKFWDEVNYSGGNLTPWRKWKEAPRRSPEITAAFYRDLRAFLRRLKADGRFEITDCEKVLAAQKPRVAITRAHVPAIRAALEKDFWTLEEPASWCVADCFQAAVKFLRGEREHTPGKVYGFLERPVGMRETTVVSAAGLRAAARTIPLARHLPAAIEVDGRRIGPADFLMAALEALETSAEKVTVRPREQLGDIEGHLPRFAHFHQEGHWLHTPEFKDRHVSDRVRWQIWTLRYESK